MAGITKEAIDLLNITGRITERDYRLDAKKRAALRRLLREGRIFSYTEYSVWWNTLVFVAPGLYCPLEMEVKSWQPQPKR